MLEFKGISFVPGFDKICESRFSRMQDYVDDECIKKMRDYVPVADSKYENAGKMRDSFKVESPGIVINTEPKARREYYTNEGHGIDGINSVKGRKGLRGKYFFERMKADHLEEIEKGAKEKFT